MWKSDPPPAGGTMMAEWAEELVPPSGCEGGLIGVLAAS
jgi:hypothetical protein